MMTDRVKLMYYKYSQSNPCPGILIKEMAPLKLIKVSYWICPLPLINILTKWRAPHSWHLILISDRPLDVKAVLPLQAGDKPQTK
jgi:hypothetical protein